MLLARPLWLAVAWWWIVAWPPLTGGSSVSDDTDWPAAVTCRRRGIGRGWTAAGQRHGRWLVRRPCRLASSPSRRTHTSDAQTPAARRRRRRLWAAGAWTTTETADRRHTPAPSSRIQHGVHGPATLPREPVRQLWMFIIFHAGTSRCTYHWRLCLCVYPRSKRKTTWAINTKLGILTAGSWHALTLRSKGENVLRRWSV